MPPLAEMTLLGIVLAILIGSVLGSIPLIVARGRNQVALGVICLLACVSATAFLGCIAAAPVAALLAAATGLVPKPRIVDVDVLICPECGRENSVHTAICPRCSRRLSA